MDWSHAEPPWLQSYCRCPLMEAKQRRRGSRWLMVAELSLWTDPVVQAWFS